MSLNSYNHYKNLFNSVKPIRGRAKDMRPIGKRRRDWETIRMNGDIVECVLYDTAVVRYYPDGAVGLCCGGWVTPSTADYMHAHSPFYVRKQNNAIRVAEHRQAEKVYPLPERGETRFVLTDVNKYVLETPITITKQVVDRSKAKEARAPFMPFVKFVDSFLKMSDGWVMDETMAEVGTISFKSYYRAYYDYGVTKIGSRGYNGDKFLSSLEIADESDYLNYMCELLEDTTAIEKVMVREEEVTVEDHARKVRFYNYRYSADTVKAKIYRMIAKNCDVTKSEEVVFE